MAKYKNIPVDEETAEMLETLCAAYGRKQGAQVKQMAMAEVEKLHQVKKMVAEVLPKIKERRTKKATEQSVVA
ncbi:MAG: hypothetical protein HGB11_10310 [Chlorobiales bacterium]|nr:hypothetical protein [Chlorobiales bacterium]